MTSRPVFLAALALRAAAGSVADGDFERPGLTVARAGDQPGVWAAFLPAPGAATTPTVGMRATSCALMAYKPGDGSESRSLLSSFSYLRP